MNEKKLELQKKELAELQKIVGQESDNYEELLRNFWLTNAWETHTFHWANTENACAVLIYHLYDELGINAVKQRLIRMTELLKKGITWGQSGTEMFSLDHLMECYLRLAERLGVLKLEYQYKEMLYNEPGKKIHKAIWKYEKTLPAPPITPELMDLLCYMATSIINKMLFNKKTLRLSVYTKSASAII